MSDDRWLRVLLWLTILLFVSAGILPLARGRRSGAKWARWGSIVMFSVAAVYAALLTLRWVFG
jgi:hypothetical protein